MNKYLLFLFFIGSFELSSAQVQIGSDRDQNPNAYRSKERYIAKGDSLLQYQGATFQQTYKAYDWYEAKQERKALRRERRHSERMANPYAYNNWWYPSVGLNYWGGFNNWGWSPYIGIGAGRSWWGY